MKCTLILSLYLLIFGQVSNAQEKTIDRILDNTRGVLEIINSRKGKKPENTQKSGGNGIDEQSKATSVGHKICKFVVTNSSSKRVTVTLKLISEVKEFSKQFVLSSGDKETFRNLDHGMYEYSAKFDDGIVAKSGEIELSEENRIIEKEIK